MVDINDKSDGTTNESNAVRLTIGDWLIVAVILFSFAWGLPVTWGKFEHFSPDDGYRMPYHLNEDYWHYTRYARVASAEEGIILLGDSVIWGKYALPDQTLSCHLKTHTGIPFWNLGINGLHPVAMNGLVRHHGKSLQGRAIVLQFNPLWMSSPQYDLNTYREFRFNHPRLVPQFRPNIPCYHEPAGVKAGIVAARYLPFLGFASHLSITYYDNKTAPVWALAHPYECLITPLQAGLPDPNMVPHDDFRSWTERGMAPQHFVWADPDASRQWHFFQDTALRLRNRGNTIFVLVGPFNEYAISESSRDAYDTIIRTAQDWLQLEGFAHYTADCLPSDFYTDASHPVSAGYEYLARELLSQDVFCAFLEKAALQEGMEERVLSSGTTQLTHMPFSKEL